MLANELAKLASIAGIGAGVALFAVNEVGLISKVEGNSMQPTFNPYCGQKNESLRQLSERGLTRDALKRELRTRLRQDRVVLNKWAARDKTKLRIGDVVILISPTEPSRTLIKRITAMPGDVIYIVETGETRVIQEGHCWVEGDNQQSSYDSNNFGQVPLGLIEGLVCFIVWPLNRVRAINCDPSISSKSSKTVLVSQYKSNQHDRSQPVR